MIYNVVGGFPPPNSKLDQLTPEQQQRVENQLRGWAFVDLYI